MSSTTVYSVCPKRTKSLERATQVIGYMQAHRSSPVSVAEVADGCAAYYEEVLHILTTLEALGMVERYSREGAPKEGPRVAYLWRQPTQEEVEESRAKYKEVQGLGGVGAGSLELTGH